MKMDFYSYLYVNFETSEKNVIWTQLDTML